MTSEKYCQMPRFNAENRLETPAGLILENLRFFGKCRIFLPLYYRDVIKKTHFIEEKRRFVDNKSCVPSCFRGYIRIIYFGEV